MRLRSIIIGVILSCTLAIGYAQEIYPLYPGKIINSISAENLEKWETDPVTGTVRVSNVSIPTIQVFPAKGSNATDAAVVIFPGGGYVKLGMNTKGTDVTNAFNAAGVTAFVVKYRLPSDRTMPQKQLAPIQDARRAMQFVKENASKWHLDTAKVGVVGFSAGGHVASSLGTSFRDAVIDSVPLKYIRPAFMVLIYPVISMDKKLGNGPSTQNLLGKNPDDAERARFSNQLHVDAHTPPAFIVHAADDNAVPVKSSLLFYETLLQHGVKSELIVYPTGGHGFNLVTGNTTDKWIDHCVAWMAANHWIPKP
ncbi:acetyl esterase/lipase [Mucilaginibacter yixingensis]|uniref:Acetyl esterase/lipase n=1 Tax=Mucilaginibacter yixingensis TaxID=1295612 RepID=A0A2T5JAS3_9SPHI|nr:alpha/beta hydrolase [Mucilaginibacter yixingensis]PTQ97889.1 acetyl esterase/lipase [Mucilaginibacter yixingensis]